MKQSYLHLNECIDCRKFIVATFRIESKLPLTEAAEKIAAESSIGTWTELSTLDLATFKKLHAHIIEVNKKTKMVKIAYPLELFESGSIPQFLSSVCGNIFSMKAVDNLRLEDVDFPEKYVNGFLGPRFGIKGIRKLLNIYDRPLIGCIAKPKLGLGALEHAGLVYRVMKNGVDVVKDDENLTDMSFNHFKKRAELTIKASMRAEKETGSKKMCILNVTAPPDVMLERAQFIKKMGGRCAMIDIVSVGLDSVQYLRKQNLGLVLHGHRAGHSAFTRDVKHGISMLVIAKLARLAGIDQLHTGTVVGKMEGTKEEVLKINAAIEESNFNIKPTMPIASGGLHPALTPALVKILGNDVIINFGGGLHGHPDGSEAGARACYQSVEATIKNIPLKKYALEHEELAKALDFWK